MEKGKIIVLNGVSSSGKTTLAKCLQQRSEAELVWLSVDTFCHMWPDKCFEGDFTETYLRIQEVMWLAVKLLADQGINVVADVVLLEPHHSLEKLIAVLKGYSVMLVQVTCPIEELRRREIERGDREQGQGESQIPYLTEACDATVDTFHTPVEGCADEILRQFACAERWTAFEQGAEEFDAS